MSKKWLMVNEGRDYRKIGGLVKRLVHPITTGSKNLGMSICLLHPGEEIIIHNHGFEEAYYVVQGRGVMTLDDETIELEPNLAIYIPENANHGQKNTGNEPMVIICAVSPPSTDV